MRKIALPDQGAETLFGTYDENLKHLESLFNVRIRTSGQELVVEGDASDVARAERVLDQLSSLMRGGYRLGKGDVRTASQLVAQDDTVDLSDYFLKSTRTSGKRQVLPKSLNQRRYLDAIEAYDIVFGIGPAGTGKTYLAMAQAVSFLLAKKVNRIILARPAVEAGEKLGFLPGDLQEKVNPYLRPLYDALYDMLDARARRTAGRARHDRSGADCLHARPHAERRLRHPRRGAEHHVRADEDVPDAPRLRIEGGDHRRHHADRPADRPHVRTGRSDEGCRPDRGHRVHSLRRKRRRAPPAGAADRQGVRSRTVDPDSSRFLVTVTDGRGRPVRDEGLASMGGRSGPRAPARGSGDRPRADARVRALNRRYRRKDRATDVLSFRSDSSGSRVRDFSATS